MAHLRLTVLTDNPASWVVPWVEELREDYPELVHVHCPEDLPRGEVLLLLGCERLLTRAQLARHKSNVVIHPSALPQGRGWSPLAWQVLAGASRIPVTLFEAAESADAGEVYLVDEIDLDGSELNDEIKALQGQITLRLARAYLRGYPMSGRPQQGAATYYSRRTPADSELDPDQTIRDQFNLLRVVDNDRYPAFFRLNGTRYRLTIERDAEET